MSNSGVVDKCDVAMLRVLLAEFQRSGARDLYGPRAGLPAECAVGRHRKGFVRRIDCVSCECVSPADAELRRSSEIGDRQGRGRLAQFQILLLQERVDIGRP